MSKQLTYSDFRIGDKIREKPIDPIHGEIIRVRQDGIPVVEWTAHDGRKFEAMLLRPNEVEITDPAEAELTHEQRTTD